MMKTLQNKEGTACATVCWLLPNAIKWEIQYLRKSGDGQECMCDPIKLIAVTIAEILWTKLKIVHSH